LAGRQLLPPLDDAAGGEQVRPLLPGSAGSLVLVTSRLLTNRPGCHATKCPDYGSRPAVIIRRAMAERRLRLSGA
jgi:hypothetical protein